MLGLTFPPAHVAWRSFLRLVLAGACVLGLGLAIPGIASAERACPSGYSVSPGLGSSIITKIRTSSVSCASANRLIVRVERKVKAPKRVQSGGVVYSCRVTRVGSAEFGQTNVRCRNGRRSVRWHASYGI